jgi:general secretion pathway protein G
MTEPKLTKLTASRKSHRGYTVLELIGAVAIIACMTAIGLPMYTGSIDKARNSEAAAELMRIDAALERTRANGTLPANLGELNMGALNDPWGNPYQYLNIEAGVDKSLVRKDRNLSPLNTDYDLYSLGKDGESKTPLTVAVSRDDIVRAGNGGFVGLAEDF